MLQTISIFNIFAVSNNRGKFLNVKAYVKRHKN